MQLAEVARKKAPAMLGHSESVCWCQTRPYGLKLASKQCDSMGFVRNVWWSTHVRTRSSFAPECGSGSGWSSEFGCSVKVKAQTSGSLLQGNPGHTPLVSRGLSRRDATVDGLCPPAQEQVWRGSGLGASWMMGSEPHTGTVACANHRKGSRGCDARWGGHRVALCDHRVAHKAVGSRMRACW